MDYTKLKTKAEIEAAEQKFRPLDTPPGANPFADLHTDTEWLKKHSPKRPAARRPAARRRKK